MPASAPRFCLLPLLLLLGLALRVSPHHVEAAPPRPSSLAPPLPSTPSLPARPRSRRIAQTPEEEEKRRRSLRRGRRPRSFRPFNRKPRPLRPSSPMPSSPSPSLSAPLPLGANVDSGDSSVIVGNLPSCKVDWSQKVRPDFKQAEILALIKWISKQTCQNFLLSDNAIGRNQISVLSEASVSLRDAYNAFFASLEANQLAAIPSGRFWKIIPIREATKAPTRTYTRGDFLHPDRDEIVTYLFRLKHLEADATANFLRQILSPSGNATPYGPSGVIIIIEYASNIRRILKILRELDLEQATTKDKLYVIPVKHAQAQDIAQKLQQLFQVGTTAPNAPQRPGFRPLRVVSPRSPSPASPASAEPKDEDSERLTKLAADERSNQLIVLANPRAIRRVVGLLRSLDIPLPDDGQIRVHQLKFASADELAQTLTQITQGSNNARRTPNPRFRAPTAGPKKAAEMFEGEVKVTADKATNSLVVVASRRDYESLMRVIDQLDIARKQVFVEIVILEVSVDKSRELGLAFHGAQDVSGNAQNPTVGLLGTRVGGLNSLVLDPSALTGLALGLRGSEVPNTSGILGTSTGGIPSFGVLLRAIQTSTDVDIISTPHILTSANNEAILQVGQNVPFIAGTTFTGGAAGIPAIRNIQRQDVALTLKLKPQVDTGRYVRIDFEQELTELAGQDPELGPTTSKRKIKTVVLARDRQTIVIGGLMRDKVTNSISKVPLLGDIPLLGTLFRFSARSTEKRNLLVFLTPHIIHSMSDFRSIFRKKMKERQDFLDLFYAHGKRSVQTDIDYSRRFGLFDRIQKKVILPKPPPPPPPQTLPPPIHPSDSKNLIIPEPINVSPEPSKPPPRSP